MKAYWIWEVPIYDSVRPSKTFCCRRACEVLEPRVQSRSRKTKGSLHGRLIEFDWTCSIAAKTIETAASRLRATVWPRTYREPRSQQMQTNTLYKTTRIRHVNICKICKRYKHFNLYIRICDIPSLYKTYINRWIKFSLWHWKFMSLNYNRYPIVFTYWYIIQSVADLPIGVRIFVSETFASGSSIRKGPNESLTFNRHDERWIPFWRKKVFVCIKANFIF